MANILQDKIVKYLTIGLFLAALGLLIQYLLSQPSSLPETSLPIEPLPQLPEVILSVKNLSNWQVENLKPFAVVEAPAHVGRDNPFEPYPLKEEIYATSLSATTTATSSARTMATSTP